MKPILFFLRAAALLDGLLLSYPVLAVLEIAFTDRLDTGSSLPRLGIILAAGILGALTGWLLERMKRPPVRAVMLLLAVLPAAAFGGVVFFLLEKSAFHAVLILLCLIFYAAGMFFSTHPFDELIGTSFLSLTMIAYLSAAVIVWLCGAVFSMECDSLLLIISFLAFILLYAMIGNQSSINRLMDRRHYDLSMLPAGIRRYNLLLICAGFLLVLSGLLFQKQIAAAVLFLLRILGSLLYIFVLIFNLITWALRKNLRPDEPLPQVGNLPILGDGGTESAATPFFNILFQWFAVLLAVLCLFFLRRQIWHAVKMAALAFWRLLKSLFTRPGRKAKARGAVTEYYYDTVESLEQTSQKPAPREQPLSSARLWRQRYRDFLKKPQDAAFFKEGYSLILAWLKMRGAPLSPADTTLEILNKALTRMPESPFSRVTEGYNGVFYGESPLREGDTASLLKTLEILSSVK